MYSTTYNLWTFTWFVHFELHFRLKMTEKNHTKRFSKFRSNIYSILFDEGESWDLYCSSLCFPVRCLCFRFTVLCCFTGKFRTNSCIQFIYQKYYFQLHSPPLAFFIFFHCIEELCMKNKILFANFRFRRKWIIFEIKDEITKIDILTFWIIVISVKLENVTELIRFYKI